MVNPLARSVFTAGLISLLVSLMATTAPVAKADHFACHVPNRGWGFDTFEYEDFKTDYGQIIDLAVRGWAVPPAYSIGNGEVIDVSYQGVESGPRGARQPASQAAAIPPSIYKSIAWIEAGWSHASSQVPYGGTGPIILSIDCGYGIGQITSGMGHLSAPPALDVRVPSARQAAIGTHPVYNVAEGVRILADKWNSAPNFRPIAGLGDPASMEDWYYAIWSYNGFAFSNHPLNPVKEPLRGSVWHCGDPNAPGYGFFERSDYTYTEDVYGCLRYPPVPSGTSYPPPLPGSTPTPPAAGPKFAPGDTALVVGTGTGLRIRATAGTSGEELTVVPDGTRMIVLGGPVSADGLVWWNVQFGGTVGWSADQYLSPISPEPEPDAPVNPAGRIWAPQVFSMPNLASAEIAEVFAPANFLNCQDADFSGGCPAMDFPTTPHYDSTPAPDPGLAANYLGNPVLQVDGARQVSLTAGASTATTSPITLKNTGTALAPYRVRTSTSWLIVRHVTDFSGRVVDGGVAIGSNVQVVTQSSPRITTAGKDVQLLITVDPRFLAAGVHTGTVIIDPLLGGGVASTFTVSVTSTGGGGDSTATPVSSPPSPTPTPTAPTFRSILPNLSREPH